MKIFWISIIIFLVLAAAGVALVTYVCTDDWCFIFPWQKIQAVDSFERCAGLGFPVMESYPRQCRAGNKSFVEVIKPVQLPYSDVIHVVAPIPNALIQSPLVVRGEARGNWYFEASFPIKLLDANGKEIAIVPARAQGDWMTTEFVPFEATLSFSAPATKTGTLILQNDNPSGLAENAKEVRIPIKFSGNNIVSSIEFNKPTTMYPNNSFVFSDGLLLNVKEINDSRCKLGAVCVWQGELSVVLTLLHGSIGESSAEIRLGTVNNKSVSLKGYIFSLESITEQVATIIVSALSAGSESSGINGYIHMGPICPVESYPPDPGCADRPYTNAAVLATNAAGKQYQGKTDTDGKFRIAVPVGTYTVTTDPKNIYPHCGTHEAVVTTDRFTSVNISCDSGIR